MSMKSLIIAVPLVGAAFLFLLAFALGRATRTPRTPEVPQHYTPRLLVPAAPDPTAQNVAQNVGQQVTTVAVALDLDAPAKVKTIVPRITVAMLADSMGVEIMDLREFIATNLGVVPMNANMTLTQAQVNAITLDYALRGRILPQPKVALARVLHLPTGGTR